MKTAPSQEPREYHGAKTVNRWRDDYLDDWARRMERLSPTTKPKIE